MNRTCDGRKDIVRVGADQSDRPHDKDKNHRQHHRILGNVLGFVVKACVPTQIKHVPPPSYASRTVSNCEEGWTTAEYTGVDRERRGWPSPQIRLRLCASRISLSSINCPVSTSKKPCPTWLLLTHHILKNPRLNHAEFVTFRGHLRPAVQSLRRGLQIFWGERVLNHCSRPRCASRVATEKESRSNPRLCPLQPLKQKIYLETITKRLAVNLRHGSSESPSLHGKYEANQKSSVNDTSQAPQMILKSGLKNQLQSGFPINHRT
jgi:hypothetical protein